MVSPTPMAFTMPSALLAMPRGSRLYGSPLVGSSTAQTRTSVVSAKNGSMQAELGSGIRHMSDSLIAFQPAIEEPSNIMPSAKVSSSIMVTSKVTCCHLPRGSVKRRSTYFTSLSLMDFRTSLAVFMNTPYGLQVIVIWPQPATVVMLNTIGCCSIQYQSIGSLDSDGVEPGFPGSDANGFLDIGYEDLAVADAAGLGRAPYRVDRFLDQVVGDHDLDFDLGLKIHDVLCTAIKLGVTLLPSEALGFGDRDALQSDFLKRLFHLVELERLDDGFDFFH